nr:SIR2 family protein [Periweissella fabalis]
MEKINGILSEGKVPQPNKLHELIFKPQHIITTNYDTLLEDMINRGLKMYSVLKKDDDIPYADSTNYLIKMHGDLAENNIVLKEDDYLEYENNFPMMSTLIKSLIMNNTLLFVGYSLNDSTFNSIYHLIQNTFGENDNQAYFYTPEKLEDAYKIYYSKKGLFVISTEEADLDKGKATEEFLEKITTKNRNEPKNAQDLWNNIKHLNSFAYLQVDNVVEALNLKQRAYLSNGNYKWVATNANTDTDQTESAKLNFDIDIDEKNNTALINFLDSKTMFIEFLNLKFSHTIKYNRNNFLNEAFELYESMQYTAAKDKFEELANIAFERGDYINALIARKNVDTIHLSIFDQINKKPEKSDALSNSLINRELNGIINSIMPSAKGDSNSGVQFFNTEIYKNKFAYNTLAELDYTCVSIENEMELIKQGGFSISNNLFNAKFKFYDFVNFIQCNCICIYQYTIFQDVVTKYFHILAMAYKINHDPSDNRIFKDAATEMAQFELVDLENIVPFIKPKNIDLYLGKYGIKSIQVSDEGIDYILDQAIYWSAKITQRLQPERNILERYVQFLAHIKKIEKQHTNRLVKLFEDYTLFNTNRDELKPLLKTISKNFDVLTDLQKHMLKAVIERQLAKIVTGKYEFHDSNFYLYVEIMNQYQDKTFDFSVLKDIINIDNVTEYESFLIYFFKFFDTDLKQVIIDIMNQYAKLAEKDMDAEFIGSMILAKIYRFEDQKEYVLNQLSAKGNMKEDGIHYPDKQKNALAYILDLKRDNYFSSDEVTEKLQEENVTGKLPELDWEIYQKWNSELISNFASIYPMSELFHYFGTNEKSEERLNKWIIDQARIDKFKFKFK